MLRHIIDRFCPGHRLPVERPTPIGFGDVLITNAPFRGGQETARVGSGGPWRRSYGLGLHLTILPPSAVPGLPVGYRATGDWLQRPVPAQSLAMTRPMAATATARAGGRDGWRAMGAKRWSDSRRYKR